MKQISSARSNKGISLYRDGDTRSSQSVVLDANRRGGSDSGERNHRTMRDYYNVVRKHWRVYLATLLTVLIGTAIYSFVTPPIFTASATLNIKSYSPLLPGTALEDTLRQQTREQDYFSTQVQLLTSLPVADRALSEDGLDKKLLAYLGEDLLASPSQRNANGQVTSQDGGSTLFQKKDDHYEHPIALLEAYRNLIKVDELRKTTLVKVIVSTTNAEFSAQIANAHTRAFIQLVGADRRQSTIDSQVFLQNQAHELERKLVAAEQSVAAYAESNGIIALDRDENIVAKRISELSAALTETIGRRIRSEAAANGARNGNIADFSSTGEETLKQIRTAVDGAKGQYAMLRQKFGPQYPKMLQLQNQIDSLEKDLAKETERAIERLDAIHLADLVAEEKLRSELASLQTENFDLSKRQVRYNALRRENDSLKDLYQTVLRQLKEAQLNSENAGSNIVLSEVAATPVLRSSPKRAKNMLLAIIAGNLLGFALVMLLEYFNSSLETPAEVDAVLGLPTLGIVPEFEHEAPAKPAAYRRLPQRNPLPGGQHAGTPLSPYAVNGNGHLGVQTKPDVLVGSEAGEPALLAFAAPGSLPAESFRTIRTTLLLSSAERPPRTLLFTSAIRGEGKTTVAANVAHALAQASSRVILVEADLRRPEFTKSLQVNPLFPGLVDYLTGFKTLEQATIVTEVPGLSILPAGSPTPSPGELIGSAKMAELLRLLESRYDYVILDSPPVLPVADALSLSRLVEGVVLVVAGQKTPIAMLQDAVTTLHRVNARMLGVVLNRLSLQRDSLYILDEEYMNECSRERFAAEQLRQSANA